MSLKESLNIDLSLAENDELVYLIVKMREEYLTLEEKFAKLEEDLVEAENNKNEEKKIIRDLESRIERFEDVLSSAKSQIEDLTETLEDY